MDFPNGMDTDKTWKWDANEIERGRERGREGKKEREGKRRIKVSN